MSDTIYKNNEINLKKIINNSNSIRLDGVFDEEVSLFLTNIRLFCKIYTYELFI